MHAATEVTPQSETAMRQRRLEGWRHFIRVLLQRKVVIVSAVVLLLLIITAILAPLIAPYDPYQQNLKEALLQPSWRHILGTDAFGRDTLSRIIYASRISLLVGIVSVGIAAGVGIMLGLIAGFFGGWVNVIIMRFIDALMSIPPIILALVIATALGGGINNVIIAIGVALVPVYCRTMCGQVLSIKQTDYIMAARLIGAGNLRIMFRHILPNSLPPLLVLITLQLGLAILAEAGLSFLGLGITPPGASWGSMIAAGYGYLSSRPILSIAPGICIVITVLAFNLLGDGFRDALDPRLRGTI